ncbi:transposase [Streptomyces pristinaespiralis]|uniref:transposase n=1 Tax=Streptomyces pristinaespiralis TaxID=38300 RepID=UPI0001801736|nr:transposase [Streptomyces pristinaespiralis]QMU17262.1 transposase [Streptomyces pristinaespiralis]
MDLLRTGDLPGGTAPNHQLHHRITAPHAKKVPDAEWAVLEPLLPVPACELPTGGRAEKHPRRNVVDAIRYVNDWVQLEGGSG